MLNKACKSSLTGITAIGNFKSLLLVYGNGTKVPHPLFHAAVTIRTQTYSRPSGNRTTKSK